MTMTLKLPPEMELQLRHRSDIRGTSVSALMREALQAYLDIPAPQSPSAYELGKDLFGRYSGPDDLSTNRKQHLLEIWNAKHEARSRNPPAVSAEVGAGPKPSPGRQRSARRPVQPA